MPNGHGGVLRYGSPLLLFLVLCYLAYFEHGRTATSTAYLAYLIAALFGWRLAWHVFLWDSLEYGGQYLTPAARAAALMRYRVGSIVLVVAAIGAVAVIWPRLRA